MLMKNESVMISIFLIVIMFFVSVYTTGSAVSSVVTDNGASSNATPKEETPPQTIPTELIDCQHQCDINAKQCIAQGTEDSTCQLANNACYKQCSETGKPTEAVPPPPLSPAAAPATPQPQPSPELIECKYKCDVKNKNCASSGTDQNICNQELNKCNDECEQQSPLQPVQPTAQVSLLLDYGDAPDPTFPSLKSSNGARHVNTEYEWLGPEVTKEGDSLQINADDKDDGITISNIWGLQPCAQVVLPVIVSVKNKNDPAHIYGNNKLLYLNMLFDWDMSGKWEGAVNCGLPAPEHAVVNYPINVSNWPQDMTTKTIGVSLVTGPITQNIWARATLTYDQKVNFPWSGIGEFSFGETEDYGPIGSREPPPNLRLPSTPEGGTGAKEIYELPLPKKANGGGCHNNSECESNLCYNGICTVALVEQPAQPRLTINAIVQAINNFFSRLFG